jgi:signal transduction histidine kinase
LADLQVEREALKASEAERRTLALVWENAIEDAVAVDAQRVRQIALNLLINACTASPPRGTVRLAVSREPGAIALHVADDGPGQPDVCRETLTGAGASPARPAQGLGLWTVARLVAELDGTIDVKTAGSETGTEIMIRIPIRVEEARNAA